LTGWQPLATQFKLDDLPIAVYVTSRSWREAAMGIAKPEASQFVEALANKVTLPECATAWTNYLSAQLVVPGFRRVPMAKNGETARPPGAPFLLRLRLFGMRHLHLGPDELEDMVLADLVWLWLCHAEEEGAIRLYDDEEIQFEAWCRAQDLLRAQSSEPTSTTREETVNAPGNSMD
jgi:hypothetical protein